MAKYSNTVEYNIKTTLDSSGITKLQSQLSQLEQHFNSMGKQRLLPQATVNKALGDIKIIQSSLQSAFNGKLGMIDNKAFLASLTSTKNEVTGTKRTLNDLWGSLSAGGSKGVQAFTQMYGQLGKIDTGLKQISKTSDKIMNTLGNTVRWGLIASGFSQIMNAAHQSVQYVKELDTSLTNIMMVSGETKDNMNEFAKQANEVAQRLGGTTTQMTEATKVFVQQGMSLGQSSEMAEYAVHLANISEQDSTTTSDELTAMKNAFHLEIDDMGNAVSKWAAIANNAAVSMEELSVASQKAASVANTVGVDMDQFAGHIAAIEATTREAPENIGNGLKTLYSRISDIKLGETLEDGVDYGQFSSALKKVGVDVLDASGKMKDAGDIIEEIMAKWQELDQTQRTAVATTVAGRFQLARFEALMNSQDIYQKSVQVARAETGTETYDRMQETYRDSLEGRSKALQASIEEVFLKAFDTESFYGLVDATTKLVQVFGDLIEAVGGGSSALTALAALITKFSSNQIGKGISNFISNRQTMQLQKSNVQEAQRIAQEQVAGQGLNVANKNVQQFVNDTANINRYAPIMTKEQIDQANTAFEKRANILIALTEVEERYKNIQNGLAGAFRVLGVSAEAADAGFEQFLNELKAAGTDAEAFEKALKENGFDQFIDKVHNAETELTRFIDLLDSTATESEADWDKIQTAASKLAPKIKEIAGSMKIGSAEAKQMGLTYRALEAVISGDVNSIEQLSAMLKNGGMTIDGLRQGLISLQEAGKITAEDLAGLNAQLNEWTIKAKFASQEAQGLAQGLNIQNVATQMTNIASAGMSAIFAIQSIHSLIKTINDEDMDPFEKMENIFLNLTMVVAMTIPAITQTMSAIKALQGEFVKLALTQMLAGKATVELTAETKALVIAELQEAAVNGKVPARVAAEIAARHGVTAAKIMEIAATEDLVVATGALMLELLPLIAVFAGVGLAIYGVVKYIQQAEEHYHRFDKAVEDAAEKVNNTNEALKNAQTKLQDVSTALDNLNENPFEGLTKGTQEWTDALYDANNAVLELIEKYPELANFVEHGENGELTLSKAGLEEYKQIAQTEVAAAQARSMSAQQEEARAKEMQSAVNFLRAGTETSDFSSFKGNFEKNDVEQGNIVRKYDEEEAAQTLAEAAKLMAQNADQDDLSLRHSLVKAGIASDEMAEELVAERNALIAFGESLLQASDTAQHMAEANAAAMMSSNELYQNADAAVQRTVDQKVSELVLNPTEELKASAEAAFQNDQDMDWDSGRMQEWYIKQQGWEEGTTFKAGKGFIAADGTTVLQEDAGDMWQVIHDAYIESHIAEDVLKEGDELVKAYQSSFDQLKAHVGEDAASLFAGGGEINGEALQSLGSDVGGLDLSQLTMEDLQAAGFESFEEFKEAFETASATNPVKPVIDTETPWDLNTDEETDTYLENYTDIDRGVLDTATSLRMSEHEEEGNRFQTEDIELVNAATEKLTQAQETYGESSEEAARAEEELAEARKDSAKDTELYENAVKRAAAAEARQIKALKDMNEHFEDNSDILKTAEKGSIEYAEALDQTKEDLAGLLDIDAASLEDDFVASADTLNLMQQAMEGDQEAFEKLKAAAAENIISNLEINTVDAMGNPVDTEEVQNTLRSMVDDLNSQNLGIDVEADVDTSEWYNKINEMLASGAITADQLTQVLSAAGYEGEIDYIEKDGTVPAISYTLHVGETQHIGDEKGGIDFPSTIEMEPHMTDMQAKVKVPVLKGATQKGGISGGAAGGGSKGGGGGGGSCFIAGTLVSTITGYKNIENIKPGNIVISYNEKEKVNQYSIVLQTMIHDTTEKLYALYIENEKLTVTGIHRFLIVHHGKKEWIAAKDLQIGNLVLFADGTWHRISNITVEIKHTKVYNFEVSNNHNYYVGINRILAHNKGGGGGGGKGSKAAEPKKVSKTESGSAEIDLYEKVNAQLEKLNDQYSKLQKVRERTWGKNRLRDVNSELKNLRQQNKTIAERIKIAKAYAQSLRTGESNPAFGIDMKNKPDLSQFGLTDSDKDGVIENYKEIFSAARAEAQKAEDAATKYWESLGGRLDKNGNVIKEASMTDSQQEKYEEMTKKAKQLWDIANDINDVTKDYEDTMDKIRDDEAEMLDHLHEMEDLQIDMYQRSLEALDNLKDIKDTAADIKGVFSGLGTESPFRDLIEDAQRFEDIMYDENYNPVEYYNEIIASLEKERSVYSKNTEEYKKYTEAIKFYNDEKAKALLDNDGLGSGELAQATRRLNELARWMNNPTAVDNPFGTNTEELYQEYLDYYQKVADLTLEAEERMEAINESVINSYDEMAERQDELLEKYDKLNDRLERTSDRVALWQGEDAYQAQADIATQRGRTSVEAARAANATLQKYQKQLEKAEIEQEKNRAERVKQAQNEVNRIQQELNKDKNNKDLQQQLANAKVVLEQAKHDDSEEVKWLKDQIDETTDYIEEKQDEAAEAFKDAYENKIDELNAQMNERVFGDRDLGLGTDDWERDKDYYTTYKDDVERVYEIEKLRSRYLGLLDDAQGSSLAIQRQIKNAMDDQLDLLQNQTTMSEYDVKLANARLEILQKQIALENAQQNKNQMKLRRDTQGNYKYVYAADQDDVREKEQDLLDSQFDAYEISKEGSIGAKDRGIALYSQYQEQRAAIEKKYGDDSAKLQQELIKLNEDYLRAVQANAEDLQDTYNGMVLSVEWMANTGTEAVQEMTNDVLDALSEKTQESLEAVGIPWNDAIASGLSDLDNIEEAVDDTTQSAIAASQEYINYITDPETGVGAVTNTQFGEAQQAIADTANTTRELASATQNLNDVMGAELGAIDEAKNKIIEYQKELEKAKNSSSALASRLTSTQADLAYQTAQANQWKTTYEDYVKAIENEKKRAADAAKNGGGKNGSGSGSTKDIAWGIAQNIWTYGSWGNDPYRNSRIAKRYGKNVANQTQKYLNDYINSGRSAQLLNWNSKKWGYASGGYTGEWGNGIGLDGENGKLAFLHQKELVLNQEDTKNILEAVQVMRSVMDMNKLASLNSSSFNSNRVSQSAATDTIEQRVEITAEFPAANSANEIKQALLGLADSAMQYAYRER